MTALVEETPVLPSSREDIRPERSLERRRERERERSPPARGPRDERAARDNRRGRIDERSDRRDRDRDYKRRKSMSPGFRDRRQSPSKRLLPDAVIPVMVSLVRHRVTRLYSPFILPFYTNRWS